MERLTARNGEYAYYPNCFQKDKCDGKGHSEKCNECDFAYRVCEQLAAYEETGLTPEQLKEIDKLYREKCEMETWLKETLSETLYELAAVEKKLEVTERELEALQAEKMAAGWVSVEERLPARNKCVLVKAESTTIAGKVMVAVGACDNGFWFIQNGIDTLSFPCVGYKVVKWRELPEDD